MTMINSKTIGSSASVVMSTSRVIWFICLLVIGTQMILFSLFNNHDSNVYSTKAGGTPLSLVDIQIATAEGSTATYNTQRHRIGVPPPSRLPVGNGNWLSHPVQSEIRDFERQDGVVIAVKIHGDKDSVNELQQSLCLLKQAYNGRMQYDHVVFTTLQLPDAAIANLKILASPAKLTVVRDSKSVLEEIQSLSESQRQRFFQRCNFTQAQVDEGKIKWKTKCQENLPHVKNGELSYNWMAEFRTKHLWTHPALAKYDYMMWVRT